MELFTLYNEKPTITKSSVFGIIHYFPANNIFRFEFTINTELNNEDAFTVFNFCNSNSILPKYKLITIMKTKLTPTKDIYDFYNAEFRNNHILKETFVLVSATLKVAGNFYLRVKKPKIPTKIFNNEPAAFNWINSEFL